MTNQSKQFDNLGLRYADFIKVDPVRRYLHYPAIIDQTANVSAVLDMGCGDGTLSRLVAEREQIRVSAFDIAPNLIDIAHRHENEKPQGIEYQVSDVAGYISGKVHDLVISVMVLPYAKNFEDLREFFACAYRELNLGQSFISIVFNPAFEAFDEVVANRKFVKKGDVIEVNFLDLQNKNTVFTSNLRQFSKEEYEAAAKLAGFTEFSWQALTPAVNGLSELGEDFWESCIKDQPYQKIICKKI